MVCSHEIDLLFVAQNSATYYEIKMPVKPSAASRNKAIPRSFAEEENFSKRACIALGRVANAENFSVLCFTQSKHASCPDRLPPDRPMPTAGTC